MFAGARPMSRRFLASVLVLALASTVTVLAQDASRAPTEIPPGLDCASCHSAQTSWPHLHKAVSQGCDACHDQEGKKHVFKLTMPVEKLCLDCHKEKIDADRKVGKLHPPVEKSDCGKCHDPHGSAGEKLLKPQPDSCLQCHSTKVLLKSACVHKPVREDCGTCHKGHASPNEKLLTQPLPALCLDCHDEINKKVPPALQHKPVKEGECTLACHTPHAGPNAKLLQQPLVDLCLDCHDDVKKAISTAKTPHKALGEARACLTCHDAHGGKSPKLMREDTTAKVCFQCHKDKAKHVAETANNPHEPVAKGDCAACHSPHGGTTKLLKRTYPETFYAPFDAASYGLCFSCHKSGLATEKTTTSLTGFRDGDRNLHAVHAAKSEKGRTCRACHDVHGAAQPKLIRTSFKFGDWDAPIKFQVTQTGGKCSPACHVAKEYDRETPRSAPSLLLPKAEAPSPSPSPAVAPGTAPGAPAGQK